MKIEKLNENKIRLMFSVQELESQNINYHTFMSNVPENNEILNFITNIINSKTDFDIKNSNISIETLELASSIFILTIKKEALKPLKSLYKRKTPNSSTYAIYVFDNFENISEFYIFLKENSPYLFEKIKEYSNTYYINKKFYLIIENINLNIVQNYFICSSITEFATFKSNSKTLINKIKENYLPIKNKIELSI